MTDISMTGGEGAGRKLIELAEELVRQTKNSRIQWKRSHPENRWVYAGAEGSVSIEGPPAGLGFGMGLMGDYVLRVLDTQGNEIQRLASATSGMFVMGNTMLTGRSDVLRDLYDLVTGGDPRVASVVDGLLREVRSR